MPFEQSTKPEVWRPVVGYERLYSVSDRGRIRRDARGSGTHVGRILKLKTHKGYVYCGLYREGKQHTIYIHRMVSAAFIGPCPSLREVNHRNGDRTDNSVFNLEYVTKSENCLHAVRVLGRKPVLGERHGRSTLTTQAVHDIRAVNPQTARERRELAARFGITASGLHSVLSRRTWKHVS